MSSRHILINTVCQWWMRSHKCSSCCCFLANSWLTMFFFSSSDKPTNLLLSCISCVFLLEILRIWKEFTGILISKYLVFYFLCLCWIFCDFCWIIKMWIANDNAIKQFESLMEGGQCLHPIKFPQLLFFPSRCFGSELLKFKAFDMPL